jgi:copper chaperone CopZ
VFLLMTEMRLTLLCLTMLVFAAAATARGEFLRVEVAFQGTDCLSCTESLQGRLERVRGVETVTLDLDRSVVTMQFETANKVRLVPLLSRITQDGTKISRTEVVVRGTITRQDEGYRFQPAGLREVYRLALPEGDAKLELREDSEYEIRGTASEVEPGGEPVIQIVSASAVKAR